MSATEQSILNTRMNTALLEQGVVLEYGRPSTVYRPALFIDGNRWCALYGDNLQDGVAGFGDSPAAAMRDFDREWTKPIV